MRCFCPSVKNEEELLLMIMKGMFDGSIYEYLIESMLDFPDRKLDYLPTELFEMHVDLCDENNIIFYQFWDTNESEVYYNHKKQRKIFDSMVERINNIYEQLVKLIDGK